MTWSEQVATQRTKDLKRSIWRASRRGQKSVRTYNELVQTARGPVLTTSIGIAVCVYLIRTRIPQKLYRGSVLQKLLRPATTFLARVSCIVIPRKQTVGKMKPSARAPGNVSRGQSSKQSRKQGSQQVGSSSQSRGISGDQQMASSSTSQRPSSSQVSTSSSTGKPAGSKRKSKKKGKKRK